MNCRQLGEDVAIVSSMIYAQIEKSTQYRLIWTMKGYFHFVNHRVAVDAYVSIFAILSAA